MAEAKVYDTWGRLIFINHWGTIEEFESGAIMFGGEDQL